MVEIELWVAEFNKYLPKAIEQIRNDDYLKKFIAQLKLDMFNENSHDWEPLKKSTIRRKKYLADTGEIDSENITKINVRTGKMKSALTNAAKVSIDDGFNISFQYDNKIAAKVNKAQELGRDPLEFTEDEFALIIEYVANQLFNKILKKYKNVS